MTLYALDISEQKTGCPIDRADVVALIADALGDGTYRADDPELGSWLVHIDPTRWGYVEEIEEYGATEFEHEQYWIHASISGESA